MVASSSQLGLSAQSKALIRQLRSEVNPGGMSG
jgi:hypothetical protein